MLKMWFRFGMVLFALTVLAAEANMAVASNDDEQEREVSLSQVSAKVKATILKAAGKNEIKEIEEVVLTLYEVEWTKGEREFEVYLTPDGKVLMKKVEKEDDDEEEEAEERKERAEAKAGEEEDDGELEEKKIEIDQLPAKVKAAVKKLAAENEIKLEQVRMKFYEAEWLEKGKEVEILVTVDGKRVKGAEDKPKKEGKAKVRKDRKDKDGDDDEDEKEDKD